MQTLADITGGTLYMMALGTHGDQPGESIGSIHALSNLAAADAEFDAKDTTEVFINGGFGTGLDFSETGLNGPSIFPTTSLGVRVRAGGL